MRLATGNWPVPFSVTMAARGKQRHVSGDIMQHAQPRNRSPRWRPLSWTVRGADDAGQASLVWSVPTPDRTDAATRSPAGTWTAQTELAAQLSSPVATAVDGAGDAIAVFGSSFAWHLAGGGWGPALPLPSGSSGGLVVADPGGTFVYADSSGNAFTFGAGATSFGGGSGSRGSLADLKIVPGLAVMLAAGAVSTETVS